LSTPNGYFARNKAIITLTPVKALDKGKGIASEPRKRLEGKKCLKCRGYGHFQADSPSYRTLTIREVDEIQVTEEKQLVRGKPSMRTKI